MLAISLSEVILSLCCRIILRGYANFLLMQVQKESLLVFKNCSSLIKINKPQKCFINDQFSLRSTFTHKLLFKVIIISKKIFRKFALMNNSLF